MKCDNDVSISNVMEMQSLCVKIDPCFTSTMFTAVY